VRRAERERREAEAAELEAEHIEVRARLLVTVERTSQYAADLLAEVQRWNQDREEGPA
jgi:hypothetical protein